jgi:hypothetical protein
MQRVATFPEVKKDAVVKLTPRRAAALLAFFAAGIVAVHVTTLVFMYGYHHDNVYGLTTLFDVDGERNIPSFFSFSIIMFAVGLLAYIAARQPRGAKPHRAYWVGLVLVFTYLAFDEGFELHERVARLAATWVHARELSVYAWLVPYGIGCLAFVIIYVRFLKQLSREDQLNILLAGIVYVAGAAGAEIIGALYVHVFHTEHARGYDIESAIEESLEMTGILLFIYALLKHIETHTAAESAAMLTGKKKRPATEVTGRDDAPWHPKNSTSA